MNQAVIDYFLKYVKVYTTSDPNSVKTPTTERQKDLGKMLVDDLHALGVLDAQLNEYGYVYAKLPNNTGKNVPAFGFIAHMDTSPDFNGEGVNPRIIENYDGNDILLNENVKLSPKDFPDMLKYVGQDLIVTDGNTLLGADDKAGVAEIMALVKHLQENPDILHGDICIAFTPDEEVGRGVIKFDVPSFGAEFAYTIDGGELGQLQYENFNAASMIVNIHGRMVHPGEAKDRLVHASEIGMKFHQALPQYERPEYTEDYEGFYHLQNISGSVENCRLEYIIRDHSEELYVKKKEYAQAICAQLQKQYPNASIEIAISDTYRNMKQQIELVPEIIELARTAMEQVGVRPIIEPIRGGTDGSNLSYMGLPCPNIFAGGHNFHSRFEYIPVESLKKAVDVLMAIVDIHTKKHM